jgi:ABC-type glutathione transport system ATPase component
MTRPLAEIKTAEPLAPRPAMRVCDLHKRFGELVAIGGVSFEIAQGEFFVIVGPSGCGKTTLLRFLAGLDTITSGTIARDRYRAGADRDSRNGGGEEQARLSDLERVEDVRGGRNVCRTVRDRDHRLFDHARAQRARACDHSVEGRMTTFLPNADNGYALRKVGWSSSYAAVCGCKEA